MSKTPLQLRRHAAPVLVTLATILVALPMATSAADASPPGKSAPTSLTAPSIGGSPTVGSTLSADVGTWSGPSLSYAISWQQCDGGGANCTAIGGATASSYTVAAGDAGATFRVVVVASNKNGSSAATSGATAAVPTVTPTPAPTALSNTGLPQISGTAQAGSSLTVSDGSWSLTPTSFAYQWSRCASGGSCVAISGAVGQTYAATTSDVGYALQATVTATAGTSVSATSPATAAVVAAPASAPAAAPSNTALPAISGTAQVGQTQTASTGTWSGTPTSYSYQWKSCDSSGANCGDRTGATSSTYTTVAADAGRTLVVAVTATNSGGSTIAVSHASAVVASAPTTSTPTYSRFGTATGWRLPWMTSTDQARYLDSVKSMGSGMIRIDIDWASIQAGGATSYNWTAQDAVVKGAASRGLGVLGVIAYTPAWARATGTTDKYPPSSVSTYGTFCGAVASHYASMGVHAWEVWNEPNMSGFFMPTPDVATYTAMLKQCYTKIKQVDPSATVLTGGTAPAGKYNASGSTSTVNPINWLEGIYANGGGGYFDAVGHHPYSFPYAPSTVADWSAWYQMFGTSPSLRSVMTAHGDGAKKIWATEWGAPTNGPAGSGYVSEDTQAAQVSEAFRLFGSYSWAGPLFVHDFRDDGTTTDTRENFFGLIRYDFSQKPAWAAYKAAAAAG